LYLNVYVPKTNLNVPKAVMLFIHGGNFQYQGANSLISDGRYFANFSDAIIVTIQYRIGIKCFVKRKKNLQELHSNKSNSCFGDY
jgi:carboxylesterase type B